MIKVLKSLKSQLLMNFREKKTKILQIGNTGWFFSILFFFFLTREFSAVQSVSCCTIFYIKTTDGLKNVGVIVLFYSIPFLLANFLSIKYSLKMPPLSQRTSSSGNIHAFTKGAIVRIHLKDFMLEWVLLYIG